MLLTEARFARGFLRPHGRDYFLSSTGRSPEHPLCSEGNSKSGMAEMTEEEGGDMILEAGEGGARCEEKSCTSQGAISAQPLKSTARAHSDRMVHEAKMLLRPRICHAVAVSKNHGRSPGGVGGRVAMLCSGLQRLRQATAARIGLRRSRGHLATTGVPSHPP